MKNKTKKLLSTLLAFIIVIGIFAAMPLSTYAANEIVLAAGFNTIAGLTAETDTANHTVTVTGNLTTAVNIPLSIDSGVTIIWKANYTASTNDPLVTLTGSGTFEVADGTIANTGDGRGIRSDGDNIKITVIGGSVRTQNRPAIVTYGKNNVVTITGGTVESTNHDAIFVAGDSSVITVSSGIVRSSGPIHSGIYSGGKKSKINISGGTIAAFGNKGFGIYINGEETEITVNGGTVSGESGSDAIAVVKDKAKISVSGGNVTATGTGQAINVTGADAEVTVSGNGSVEAKKTDTIGIRGENGIVMVSGGTVKTTADTGTAIYLGNASTGSRAVVSGGTVYATGSGWSHAIATGALSGGNTVVVTGGILHSVGEYGTIHIKNTNCSVTVSGGFVFGYGNSILGENNVIYMNSGTPAIIDPAVVCAWNKPVWMPAYDAGSNDAISVLPSGATATWDKEGVQNGIRYKNGATNTGFFPISDVTVNKVYTVTFSSNGGNPVTSQTVNSGEKVTKPTDPTKANNTFAGWYKDAALTAAYDFNDFVTADLALYAKWMEVTAATYTVTVIGGTGGGDYEEGATVSIAASPATEGKAFDKWTATGVALTNPNSSSTSFTMPPNNVALTATYKDLPNDEPPGPDPTPDPGPGGETGSMQNFLQANTYKPGMFTDVDEDQWYGYNDGKAIANAYIYGLMKGNSATTFNPTGNITLAEAITVAARVRSIYLTGEDSFVMGAPWYKVYVDYAISKQIIGASDFADYTRAATRAEMAYIFSRALPGKEYAPQNTVNKLPDVDAGTKYYEAIMTLYKAGVVGGSDAKGTFNPGANIKRCEAAAIITRVVLPKTRIKDKTYG